VPAAASAWLVAGLVTAHSSAAAVVAAGLWLATSGIIVTLIVGRGATRSRGATRPWRATRPGGASAWALTAIVLAVSAGVATQVAASHPARADVATAETSGGRALSLIVTAVGKIERSAAGWRFDATLERLDYGDTVITRSVPVLVRSAEVPAGLDLGARVRMSATAWPAEAGERAVLIVDTLATPELIAAPAGALALASELRHGLRRVTSGLPEPGRGLIAGLAVGDTAGVDPVLDAAMKTSSLSHLTAVSGANCALVVGIAFALAALCGARRGTRVLIALAALAGFVVLVSPEPSVVRAATMASIAMLGVLLGRSGAGLSLLTTAVALLLVLDPWLARSLGFALSVAATAALLVVAGPLADGLSRWMPGPLALGLAVPLAAQLTTGPLIVLISPQVPVYGVLANVLAAPAAPLGTVLGLLACLAAGIPFLGSGLAALAWLPAAWIASTAGTLAELPGSALWWPEGPLGLLSLALVGLAVAGVLVGRRRLWRGLSMLVVAATAVIAVGSGPAMDIAARARLPAQWSVAVCDVGQGDAIVLRSADRVAIVDTGPDPEALGRCLRTLGIERIHLLVLTHFDHDHDGGVAAIAGRVDTVLHGPAASADDERTLQRLTDGGAQLVRAAVGASGNLGDARWRVLWPPSRATPGNDASVVLDIAGPTLPPTLMLGDLSAEAQRRLGAAAPLRSTYAVVKVSHHGSADQDPLLYARLRAAVAVVSTGPNTYGHPRAETLSMLTTLRTHLVRTDTDGMIALWSENEQLRVWRERPPR